MMVRRSKPSRCVSVGGGVLGRGSLPSRWARPQGHGKGQGRFPRGTEVRAVEDWPASNEGGCQHMGMIADWPSQAACRTGDPDALFVQGAEQNVAKRICRGCPVRYECLADALDNRIEFGVWGGMTERERRALLRRHANVTSWRRMFEAAMREKGGVEKELVDAV